MRYLGLCWWFLAAPVYAQVVELPKEIRGTPGAWIIVAPLNLEGGQPEWEIDPGLQEVRLDLLFPAEMIKQLKGKVVVGTKAGRYLVVAWNAKADKASRLARCVIVIGDPGPEPGPGPGPTPVPTDPFEKAVLEAWQQEVAATKVADKAALKAAYQWASEQVEKSVTWGDLSKAVTSKNLGKILPLVRAVVTAELAKTFPASGSLIMTQKDKQLALETFVRVVKSLDKLP